MFSQSVSKHCLDWIVQCRVQNISIYMRTLLPIDHRRRHRVVIVLHRVILEITTFLLTNCIINVYIIWLDITQEAFKPSIIHQIKYLIFFSWITFSIHSKCYSYFMFWDLSINSFDDAAVWYIFSRLIVVYRKLAVCQRYSRDQSRYTKNNKRQW